MSVFQSSPLSNLPIQSFDFSLRTRIVFQNGGLNRLGELVREYGGTRVLVVSDPGIVATGYDDRAVESIRKAGAEAFLFGKAHENPTTRDATAAADFARECKIDFFVGLGGGSSMDCAKGANFLLTNGGKIQDYWGVDKATKPMLPLIVVPTTAGTGSDTQSFALISDETTHVKMACGDKKAAAKVSILDPELTLTLPRGVAAVTGMDALSHALESYVTTKRNPISRMFARQAWTLLSENFPRIFAEPQNLEARGAMLLGASLAGLAIENSMLGAAHSCANPLTAHFGTTHGIAVGLMLPHVIRKNADAVDALYADLWSDLVNGGGHSKEGAGRNGARPGELLARKVEEYRAQAELPETLRSCGADRALLPQLAKEAAAQWTASYNPKPLSEGDFLNLYESAF